MNPFKRATTIYALVLDLDQDSSEIERLEIRRILERHHFQWQQGSIYFGDASVTAATVMVAVIDLATQLPWFASSVRDIRMLRIEELSDLMPFVQRVAGIGNGEGG